MCKFDAHKAAWASDMAKLVEALDKAGLEHVARELKHLHTLFVASIDPSLVTTGDANTTRAALLGPKFALLHASLEKSAAGGSS